MNLSGCIELFETNPVMKVEAIKMMEWLHEWRTAEKYWRILDRQSDADACRLMHESILLGDQYRKDVKHLFDIIDDLEDKSIMSKEDALKIFYPKISEIYKKYYPI